MNKKDRKIAIASLIKEAQQEALIDKAIIDSSDEDPEKYADKLFENLLKNLIKD